jgi:hypothetical protein
MSARVESAPIRNSSFGPIVIAIIVALGVGAVAGAAITKAVDDRRAAVATGVAPLWDAQKLEAMEGRAMAEQFRDTVVGLSAAEMFALRQGVVPQASQSVQGSAVGLTAAEMFALRNGELAGRLQGDPVLWDAQKLEAMKGRVQAAQVGADDPPVRPHLPKHPPKG